MGIATEKCIQAIGTQYSGSYNYSNWKNWTVTKKSKSSVRDRDYKVKISKRQDASHPYTLTEVDFSTSVSTASDYARFWNPQISQWTVEKTAGRCIAGPVEYFLTPPSISTTLKNRVDSRALSILLRKSKANTALTNVGAPVAELRELTSLVKTTAKFVSNPLKTSASLLQSAVSSKSKTKDLSKRLSDVWLGVNFGLRPLVSDTQSIAESLARFHNEPEEQIYRFTAHAEDLRTANLGTYSSQVSNYVSVSYRKCLTETYACNYTWAYWPKACFSATGFDSFAQAVGLSYEGLLQTGWELTPFSWVVDYFTNIGDVLDNRYFASNLQQLYLVKSTKSRILIDFRLQGIGVTSPAVKMTGGDPGGDFFYESFTFKRDLVGSILSLPSATEISIKGLDAISLHPVTKIANLCAILAQKAR